VGEATDEGIEPLSPLPDEEEVLEFSTSHKELLLPSQVPVATSARVLATLLLLAALSGLYNGWDYTQPEQGLVRPHEWVWKMGMGAPNGSSTLTGEVTTAEGLAAANFTILVSMTPSTSAASENWAAETITDDNGTFTLTNLSSGMVALEVYAPIEQGNSRGMVHRLLLSPPPLFLEPIGFTHIEVAMPTNDEHQAAYLASNNTSYRVDYRPQEMETPLLDESAIGVYVMMGFFFIGISLIAIAFAIIGFRTGARGHLRVASILTFFSVGFLWSSCFIGLLSFALTFAIPKRPA